VRQAEFTVLTLGRVLTAALGKAEIPAEEQQYMVLEAIGYGADKLSLPEISGIPPARCRNRPL
jgi:hypothetical protein